MKWVVIGSVAIFLIAVIVVLVVGYLFLRSGGGLPIREIISPPEAQIDLIAENQNPFTADQKQTLLRYMAASPKWEVKYHFDIQRTDAPHFQQKEPFAIYRPLIDGHYPTHLNGYFSSHQNGIEDYQQTRVIISFGKPFGFGRDLKAVTQAKMNQDNVAVNVTKPRSGQPGFESYVIAEGEVVQGGKWFIEIYDQSATVSRKRTEKLYNEITKEIRSVLDNQKIIEETGYVPRSNPYFIALPSDEMIRITGDTGIYVVNAHLCFQKPGDVYTRVYDISKPDDERLVFGLLSIDYVTSTQKMGWSKNPRQCSVYTQQVSIKKGPTEGTFPARFEIWFRDAQNRDIKRLETTYEVVRWRF